jgi:hypothetical protein
LTPDYNHKAGITMETDKATTHEKQGTVGVQVEPIVMRL